MFLKHSAVLLWGSLVTLLIYVSLHQQLQCLGHRARRQNASFHFILNKQTPEQNTLHTHVVWAFGRLKQEDQGVRGQSE